jgi:hypothetical protein
MQHTTHIIKLRLWLFMCLFCSTVIAQSNQGAVKGTRTDKNFANTTEIHKTEKASDEQVLSEIEGDYGLGDVIHISNAPPVSVFLPSSVLPAKIESVTPKALPVILPAAHFKMPKNTVKKEDNSVENKNNTTPFSSNETVENKGTPSTNLADSPTENKEKSGKKGASFNTKSPILNPSNKSENRDKKTTMADVEKRNSSTISPLNTNKKLAVDTRFSTNLNTTRTHRSTSVSYNSKKSWFPFFNKKRTSKMPRTVKNRKSDRCYKF